MLLAHICFTFNRTILGKLKAVETCFSAAVLIIKLFMYFCNAKKKNPNNFGKIVFLFRCMPILHSIMISRLIVLKI